MSSQSICKKKLQYTSLITGNILHKHSPNRLVKTRIENLHPSEDEKSTLKPCIVSRQFEECNIKIDSDKTMKRAELQTMNYEIN